MMEDYARVEARGDIIEREGTRECGIEPMYERQTKYIWSLFLCLLLSNRPPQGRYYKD